MSLKLTFLSLLFYVFQLSNIFAQGPPLSEYITGLGDMNFMTIHGDYLYITHESPARISRANITEDAPVAEEIFTNFSTYPSAVSFHEGWVYYSNFQSGGGQIARFNPDIGNSSKEVVYTNTFGPNGMTVIEDYLYWVETSNPRRILRMDLNDLSLAPVVIFDSDNTIVGLTNVGQTLYFTGNGEVASLDLTEEDPNPQYIASASSANGVAVSGDKLYVTQYNEAKVVEIDYLSPSPTVTEYYTGLTDCKDVFIDEETMYVVAAGEGKIYRTSLCVQNISACSSYTWVNGITYTESVSNVSIPSPDGSICDNLTLNLTIGQDYIEEDFIYSCEPIVWIDGETYSESNNTAVFNGTTYLGCDSIITLNLVIDDILETVDVVNACGLYTWQDGNQYSTNNNTAMVTLINTFGCDSIVTLDLTLTNINSEIEQLDNTLTAQQAGASYQWIDCAAGNIEIPGATGQSFTALENSDYAVIITLNDCVENSECITVSTTGLSKPASTLGVELFPNPVSDILNFRFLADTKLLETKVFDARGQLMLVNEYIGEDSILDVSSLSVGVYFIQFSAEDGRGYSEKFIVQR